MYGKRHWKQSSSPCTRHLKFLAGNVEVYQELKGFLAQVDDMMSKPELAELCSYLRDVLTELLSMHGMNKLRMSSILAVPPCP